MQLNIDKDERDLLELSLSQHRRVVAMSFGRKIQDEQSSPNPDVSKVEALKAEMSRRINEINRLTVRIQNLF